MGVCFDRIDLATGKLMRFDVEKGWFQELNDWFEGE